jgi:hypothetical protein
METVRMARVSFLGREFKIILFTKENDGEELCKMSKGAGKQS